MPEHPDPARRGRRPQDLPADRRARGQRRRAERLRQLRRLRRGDGGRRLTHGPRRAACPPVGPHARELSRTAWCGERVRVLGVDPGLTRCGLGVVEGRRGRQVALVAVDVVRTPARTGLDAAAARDRRGARGLAGPDLPGRGRRRAGLQPAQRPHGDGHGAGRRGRRAGRGPARHPGGPAHAERGEGGGDRLRPGRQGSRSPPWSPGSSACPQMPQPGRRRRRAGAGDLPSVAGRDAGGGPRAARQADRRAAPWVEAAEAAHAPDVAEVVRRAGRGGSAWPGALRRRAIAASARVSPVRSRVRTGVRCDREGAR